MRVSECIAEKRACVCVTHARTHKKKKTRTMNNAVGVQKVERKGDLLAVLSRVSFAVGAFLQYSMKQLAAREKLETQNDVTRRVKDVVQACDVGVTVDAPHGGNLAPKRFLIRFFQGNSLHGDSFLIDSIVAAVHDRVVSDAEDVLIVKRYVVPLPGAT